MGSAYIDIAGRRVGPGSPVYFIAEAGSNHDGRLDQAKRLIDVAADAGADAVKFQAFKAASLYPRSAGRSEYLKDPRSIYDIIQSLEMPLDWVPALAQYCAERRIHFLCTPFDHQSADVLAPHVPAFKIASYDMTNYPLIQHVARKGKPLLVSTGTADISEVKEMISAAQAVGNPGGLVALQCTAKYPAPLSALNVNALTRIAALGVLPGFSDHSREPLPGPLAAIALGAVVIEKHFTLSNKLPGPDHPYAIEPDELRDLIAKVRQVESALGVGDKVVLPEEEELRAFARRTVFTTRAFAEGERLRRRDLALLRRGLLADGVHPRDYLRLCGRRARRSLGLEAPVAAADVGPLSLGDEEVALRPVEKADWPHLPAAWRLEVLGRAPQKGDEAPWPETLPLRSDRLDFAVTRGASPPVGVASLTDVDLGADTCTLSWSLDPGAGSGELAEKVARTLLDHAFYDLQLEEVRGPQGRVDEARSRLLLRLGFTAPSSQGSSAASDGQALVLRRAAWRERVPRTS